MSQPPGWSSPSQDPDEQPTRPFAPAEPTQAFPESTTPMRNDSAPSGPAPQYGTAPGTYGPPPQYGPAGGYGQPAQSAPRPGVIPLRPLTLGEIYDGAFRAIRSNPAVMLGASAIVAVLVAVVGQATTALFTARFGGDLDRAVQQEDVGGVLNAVGGAFSGSLIAVLVQVLATTVLTGLLMASVGQSVLGRSVTAGELWQQVRSRVLPLIAVSIVIFVAITAVVIALVLPIAILTAIDQVLGVVSALILVPAAVVAAVYLYIRWALATPAMILERQSILGSLRRSWRLASGSWWRLLGILLLTAIVTNIVAAIILVPFGVAGVVVTPGEGFSELSTNPVRLAIDGFGQVLANTLLFPFSAAVSALLYIDLRMRREGLDIALARAAASPTAQGESRW